MANSLALNSHKVWILSRKGRQVDRLDPLVHFQEFHFTDAGLPSQLLHLCRFIRRQNIDVIHVHQRLTIKIACLVGKLLNLPVIATVHGKTRHDLSG